MNLEVLQPLFSYLSRSVNPIGLVFPLFQSFLHIVLRGIKKQYFLRLQTGCLFEGFGLSDCSREAVDHVFLTRPSSNSPWDYFKDQVVWHETALLHIVFGLDPNFSLLLHFPSQLSSDRDKLKAKFRGGTTTVNSFARARSTESKHKIGVAFTCSIRFELIH